MSNYQTKKKPDTKLIGKQPRKSAAQRKQEEDEGVLPKRIKRHSDSIINEAESFLAIVTPLTLKDYETLNIIKP